ncbi:MAG: penicillin-binding protein 1C [Verrucomicrobia bacterium]|nr:penicillin-binding protein 1C [Verrucomicrobiota bacterium]
MNRATPAAQTPRPSRRRRLLKPLAALLGTAALLGLGGGVALSLVPVPAALTHSPPPSCELLDRHGQSLRHVREGDCGFSAPAAFAEIPLALVHATLAAEDKRFWQHPGIDWRATLRATASLVRHRRVVSGGSTLTQQLIKLAQPRLRTFRTKIVEAAQALRLEHLWTKRRILTEYLNRLDYGNLNTGCAAAAAFYFRKPLRDLSTAECAFLAALPQAPTRLNPHRHLERARARQQWILARMRACGFLTDDECRRARSEPLRLASPARAFQAPHFVDLVLQQWQPEPSQPPAPSLHTTLDLELNRFAERALARHLAGLRPHHVGNGAVVVLDNRRGDVLALVGSGDYFDPRHGQVNGAWAPRSAGSTLKPFTYLLAFEQGATAASLAADVPTEFATPTGLYRPHNYDRRCHGPVRYRLALANSLNIPAVKVLQAIGGPAVLQQRLQQCGLTTLDEPADVYGLGLTLGNANVRLIELANAYACLARLGQFQPYRLWNANPPNPQPASPDPHPALRPPSPIPPPPAQVCPPHAAWLVTDILSDNHARAQAFGLDSDLRFDFPVACKTGTSSDFRDNWALGYTPEFTVGVWMGNFDGSPMRQISGVTGAAPLLHELFEHLHRRFGTSWPAPPPNLVKLPIHPITGKQLAPPTPKTHPAPVLHAAAAAPPCLVPTSKLPGPSLLETFFPPHCPPLEQPGDYDDQGRVRLPAEYRPWLAGPDNDLGDQAVAVEPPPTLRILSPLPGTVFFLDPDLPRASRRIPLRAAGNSALRWQSDSLTCETSGTDTSAWLAEGRHRLVVTDPATGAQRDTWIVVKAL